MRSVFTGYWIRPAQVLLAKDGWGWGTIHVDSSDKTMKAFDIHNIRDCECQATFRAGGAGEDNKRVSSRFIGSYEDGDDGFDRAGQPLMNTTKKGDFVAWVKNII